MALGKIEPGGFVDQTNQIDVVRKLAEGALPSSGGLLHGHLDLDISTGTKSIRSVANGARQSGIFFDPNGDIGAYDWGNPAGGSGLFKYSRAAKTFDITSPNTNVMLKTKDGQVALTLTENVSQYGSTYPPIAIRRGTVVTIRLVVTRNANTSGILTILPSDMRPKNELISTILSTDGVPSDVVIRVNGEVEVITKSKTFYIALTYTVD